MAKVKTAEVFLEYQNYIETPPIQPAALYGQACSNDGVTIDSWRNTWISNLKENHKRFGPFKDRSIGKLFASQAHKPVIVAGSGPSLQRNGQDLKNKGDICLISCLHNFHYMEDNGIEVDYYVTLDAGDVTVEEVSEGGSKTPDEYWELTKNKTLLAFIGTTPKLLEKWKGQIYFYNAPVSDKEFNDALASLEKFNIHVSNGGNVLGACMYIAKGILGANPIAYVGADFCFSYKNKFHAWDSKYDAKLGNVMRSVDVYGNKVLTWRSYANFKGWFEWVAIQIPGLYVNCTEGGTFGSYPEGNLMAIKQMDLADFIKMYQLHYHLKDACLNPEADNRTILF